MTVHITNTWHGLVSVELNSGTTLHLAPGERSGPVEEFETGGNQWLRTLHERGRVTLSPADEEPRPGRERRRATKGDATEDHAAKDHAAKDDAAKDEQSPAN